MQFVSRYMFTLFEIFGMVSRSITTTTVSLSQHNRRCIEWPFVAALSTCLNFRDMSKHCLQRKTHLQLEEFSFDSIIC